MSEADVVLVDLDSDPARRSEVLAAIRAARPDLPIVVRSADPAAEAAAGSPTIRTTTSVNGQVSALHQAVLRWTRPGPERRRRARTPASTGTRRPPASPT